MKLNLSKWVEQMNNIYFIIAPSGSGKTSICNMLKEKYNITFDKYDISITAEQIENNDLYIIDPKGVDFFMKAYKGSKTPKIIFISSNLTTRYERMIGRAETKGKSHQEAIESSLTRIVNDAEEFYDYIQGQAWIDYVCKNNSNDKLEDVVDKIFDHISSCESEVR